MGDISDIESFVVEIPEAGVIEFEQDVDVRVVRAFYEQDGTGLVPVAEVPQERPILAYTLCG
jgi:hypothetical protein